MFRCASTCVDGEGAEEAVVTGAIEARSPRFSAAPRRRCVIVAALVKLVAAERLTLVWNSAVDMTLRVAVDRLQLRQGQRADVGCRSPGPDGTHGTIKLMEAGL